MFPEKYSVLKKFLFVVILSLASLSSFANHTKGGWMFYEYLGPGSAPNSSRYRITLKLYTECVLTGPQTEDSIPFTIFNNSFSSTIFLNVSVPVISSINTMNCTSIECHPCVLNIPAICYKIRTYVTIQELPNTNAGYIVAYQRCCRIIDIVNLQIPSNNVGETWTVTIPGTSVPGAERNSSAKFAQNDTAIICQGGRFIFDFSATDIDDDSLVYSFSPAFSGGGITGNGGPAPNPSSPPPFSSVAYATGYSGLQPLGSGVVIDRKTGIVSGVAPSSGIYVITATVTEYRRGTNIKISEVRKSLHIEVANCSLTRAVLDPEYISCDGYTLDFTNGENGNIQTYDWSFGDGSSSTLPAPSHTYADTGVYILTLVVNRGQACSDSATAIVKVFPGFQPDFSIAGQCKNTPIQFTDITTAAYGIVNKWDWNFGDPLSASNTSILKNPTHIYADTGSYDVVFIVQSSKGCYDTVPKTLVILDKPPLFLTNDTLICIIDTLQLNAAGVGSYTWTPNYNISNLNIPNPLVSPDVPTTYIATLTDPFGCVGSDSVFVDVRLFVSLFAGPDSTICQGDTTVLNIVSDGLHYLWTPSTYLNDPTLKNPSATPLTTTSYHVVANIGKCIAEEDIVLSTVPYPAANAGPDQTICFGNSTQLFASGGSSYSWSPATFLSGTNIPDPVSLSPTDDISYIVTVMDTLGCPKSVNDTMILTVAKIIADAGPRDTSVVIGQPLLLNATGSTIYSWSPSTWLNFTSISNPIALPKNNIEYVVRVSNSVGCFDTDSINVKVYKLDPDFYVPGAFTPNGDGNNDIFRPIALGLRSLDIFRVFNRYGQMLYSGRGMEVGWNGNFRGKPQNGGTYVWYAEGVDYLNKQVKRKGTVVLIR